MPRKINLKQIAKDAFFKDTHTGRNLKKELHLTKFKYVWIRKVMNIPLTMYIISYDSRFPTVFLPRFKLKDVKTSTFRQLVRKGGAYQFKNYKMTPAIDIEEFEAIINNKAIILTNDLAGEYFIDDKLFECIDGKLNRLKKLDNKKYIK